MFLRNFGIPFLLITLALAGCSQAPKRAKQSTLDTPERHTKRGFEQTTSGKWEAARQSFKLALQLDPLHGPAKAGKALVLVNDSRKAGKSNKQKEAHQEEALRLLKEARGDATTARESFKIEVVSIQLWTLLKTDDWVQEAQDHFSEAMDLVEDHSELGDYESEAHFYMGRAYTEGFQLEQATERYKKVLELNRTFTREAGEQLEFLTQILRARPQTDYGRQVAQQPSITRADMAALLVEELNLSNLYARLQRKAPKTFAPPSDPRASKTQTPTVLATDIEKHPLASDIEEVLTLGVRGLEASPQKLFYPFQTVTRAEYAVMLEDILVQLTQNEALSTQFIGETSPWGDVREDAFYYNAIRVLVSRNILSVLNRTHALFGPTEPIRGVDALMGIHFLKEDLKQYTKGPRS